MSNAVARIIKPALKRAAITAGLEGAALMSRLGLESSAAGAGLIFTLHHVRSPSPAPFQPNRHLEISPQFLDAALSTLATMGYEFASLDDVPSRLASGSRPFACFTLDDGFRDNARNAQPVFAKHGAPYTIFITQGFSEGKQSAWWETLEALIAKNAEIGFDFGQGREVLALRSVADKTAAFERFAQFINQADEAEAIARLDDTSRNHNLDPVTLCQDLVMDAEALRELAKDPLVSYGAHTVTHRGLARLGAEESRREIEASIDFVEQATGRRPTTFAYPYGDARSVSARERALIKALGLSLAVTTAPGVLHAGARQDMSALPRVSLNGLYQKPRYVRALASGLPFKLMR